MTTDLQPALLGAVSAGLLGLLAGVIRGAMYNRSEHNVRRHESRSQFLQSQVSELYSPLLAHCHEIESYYAVLAGRLGQLDAQAAVGEIGEEVACTQRTALCQRFADLYFDPLYAQIAQLLRSKRHLVAEDSFPPYLRELQRIAVDIEATRAVAAELGEEYTPCADDYLEPVREALPQLEAALLTLRAHYRRSLRSVGRLHWGRG
jgi:hypothetical protein